MEQHGDEVVSKAPKSGRRKEQAKPDITPLQATVELARRGVKEALPCLRKILDAHPELVGHYDDLARRTQHAWLELFGKNLLVQESTARQLDALREELMESRASPLERLVIQRIVACWLQTVYLDAREAVGQGAESLEMAEFRLKRQDLAQKQFLSAVKSLADLRKVTPPAVVIRIAAEAPEAKSVSGSSGRCPAEQAKAARHRPAPGNGNHRNRIADLLDVGETAGVG
jgi:hypothetical protein